VPKDDEGKRPATFEHWRKLAPSYRFGDRRRVRLCTPMYELPRTGDAFDDAFLPYVILYSAEAVGLRPVPFPNELQRSSGMGYVLLSSLASAFRVPKNDCTSLIPTFPHLVESETHLLLHHATYLSPVWGQHVAQLSELLRSGNCSEGYDSLPELVNPGLSEFAGWMKGHLRGDVDNGGLDRLREHHKKSRITPQPEDRSMDGG